MGANESGVRIIKTQTIWHYGDHSIRLKCLNISGSSHNKYTNVHIDMKTNAYILIKVHRFTDIPSNDVEASSI